MISILRIIVILLVAYISLLVGVVGVRFELLDWWWVCRLLLFSVCCGCIAGSGVRFGFVVLWFGLVGLSVVVVIYGCFGCYLLSLV